MLDLFGFVHFMKILGVVAGIYGWIALAAWLILR